MDKIAGSEFEQEVKNHNGLVIVDFYADWCGPCKAIAGPLSELANEHSDVKFVKVNADEEPELTQTYGVMGLPTLIAVKSGEVVGTKVGFAVKKALGDFIESHK